MSTMENELQRADSQIASVSVETAVENVPGRRSERPPRWLPALAAAAVLIYFAAELFVFEGRPGFPLDDAFIHLQFARNLAAGEGLSFNPGELVTGTTAPLWTAVQSIFFLLPGSPIWWTKLLGMALFTLGAGLVYRLAVELGLGRGLSLLAAVLTLSTDWLLWSALSGLEIPLFVALSLWGVRLHVAERHRDEGPPISLAVLGLAVLARPEGMLLFGLALVDRWLIFGRTEANELTCRGAKLRPLLNAVGIALVLLVPMWIFNAVIGDSVAPTTLGAKVPPARATAGALLPSLGYLLRVPIGILFRSQPYMLLLAGAGLVAMIGRLGTRRDRGLLPGMWLVGLPLAYAAISGASGANASGNFGRYFFPLFPFVVLVGMLGVERLAALTANGLRFRGTRLPLRAALVFLLLLPTALGAFVGIQRYVQTVGNVEDSNNRVAAWLKEKVPADAVLAVNDVGAYGYFLPNPVVDLAGILHPRATQLRHQASSQGRRPDEGTLQFIGEAKPDYLVIFPSWFPSLVAQGSPFTEIERFEIPDNITMGGDVIVVYSTPWTRGGGELPND